MKQKITCFCDSVFEVDAPRTIDLDVEGRYFNEILDGTFLNFTCHNCGKKHKPEFPLTVLWHSKGFHCEVIPEQNRGEFYRTKKTAPRGGQKGTSLPETIIGYPELADRLSILRDGFEVTAIEAIKYLLYQKAFDQYPNASPEVWYCSFSERENRIKKDGFLEFHIHGIRADEVAVMKIPLSLYHKTLSDYQKQPEKALFSALVVHTYLSVKNALRHEALK